MHFTNIDFLLLLLLHLVCGSDLLRIGMIFVTHLLCLWNPLYVDTLGYGSEQW